MLGLILAQVVTPNPNASDMPLQSTAQTLVNGVSWFALVFCLVGLILSAGLWAVGSFSNNYTQSVNGKKGFLISAGAALAVGAASLVVQWFYDQGGKGGATTNT